MNGYYWSAYDDGTYNYECYSGADWGYCYYGGGYGDLYSEWWYEDDGATYVSYSCDSGYCTTCVYDTYDWSSECYDDDDSGGSDECYDYPDYNYMECYTSDYYYYLYYGDDYYYESYSDYVNG